MNDSEHLDFRLLKYIVAIAESGTFTAAAAKLHVSQSALSTQIRTLEDNLGIKIFHRERGTALTPEGRVLLSYGREGLRIRDQVVQIAQAIHAGTMKPLRLAFTPLVLGTLLKTVSDVYKKLIPGSVIVPESGEGEVVINRLRTGECDAALLTLPVADETLQVDILQQERLVICMRNDDPLAAYEVVPPAVLNEKGRDFTYQEHHPAVMKCLIEMFDEIGVRPRFCKATMNFDHLQWMVEHGDCYALVRSGQDLEDGLITRPIADTEWTVDTAIVCCRERRNAALSLLVEELRRHYRRHVTDVPNRKTTVSIRARGTPSSARTGAGQLALFDTGDVNAERRHLSGR